MNVLIVDDHQAFRDEVRKILTKSGYCTDDVGSADEAIPLIENGDYDFVLLDYQMPEHDGLWLLRNARIPRHTKVLLVTSHTEPRLITEVFRAGAVGYLIKPFEEDDLVRQLAFHSRRGTQETEAAGAGAVTRKDSRSNK